MHTKTLSQVSELLTSSFCSNQKATAIVLTNKRCFLIIIRTCELDVLLESNMLRCEDNSVSMSYPQKH